VTLRVIVYKLRKTSPERAVCGLLGDRILGKDGVRVKTPEHIGNHFSLHINKTICKRLNCPKNKTSLHLHCIKTNEIRCHERRFESCKCIRIIRLRSGLVADRGTYSTLQTSKLDFARKKVKGEKGEKNGREDRKVSMHIVQKARKRKGNVGPPSQNPGYGLGS